MDGWWRGVSRQLLGFWLGALLLGWPASATAAPPHLPIALRQGESQLVASALSFHRVSVADPKVADVQVISPKEAYLYGKKVGSTTLILWEGENKTLIDVTVTLDLTPLKEQIYSLYPDQQIKVYAAQNGIVLAGTVSGPEIVEQVVRLAQAYLPLQEKENAPEQKILEDPSGTGKSGYAFGITNLLAVGGVQQVMLEVKFAEVRRDSGRDWQAALGAKNLNRYGQAWENFRGNLGTVPLGVPQRPTVETLSGGNLPGTGAELPSTIHLLTDAGEFAQRSASLLMNFAGNPANIFLDIDNFTAALNFLESESLARILAEPKLIALSGQEANFLAGGEFPIPVAARDGYITIDYKQFGVSLTFTPHVLGNGKISLSVAPEVSQIGDAVAIPVARDTNSTYIIPNLSTRRLKTTVELNDGQTLALAGLLQDNIRETVNKVPGLGDLPVIGALFRSSAYQQNKTDLLIAVTPHLVKPVTKEDLRFPGDNFHPPDRLEFYLQGQLEGRGQPSQGLKDKVSPTIEGGMEGEFGHQPLSR